MDQEIIIASENYRELDEYFCDNKIGKVLLVCGSSLSSLRLDRYFNNLEKRLGVQVVKFSDFTPNPLYESVVAGVKVFRGHACDAIMAVGGGSALDVAKCIKLFSNMNHDENYLQQKIVPNSVKLLAAPTTAGTGSESTRYAVIYYNGEKQSVADDSCLPSMALLDASALQTLPEYQRKATMLDAFCHAIESFWSVNSTEESRAFAGEAIRMILANKDAYFSNLEEGNANMLWAANLAGRAINITQTTAGHAMCYKLTSLYGIAHGHAAALCNVKLWPYMICHTDKCIDPRGETYLRSVFAEIADVMGCAGPEEAAECFNDIVSSLQLAVPTPEREMDFGKLAASVNPVRLKNNPIALDAETLRELYHQILNG